MACGSCQLGSIRAPGILRRLPSNQGIATCTASLTPTHRCRRQRRRIRHAARGSDPPTETIDWTTVNTEELEPVPILDKDIKPGKGDQDVGSDDVGDAVLKREEEAWTRREGYLSYFFSPGDNKELLIKQLPERQLDLGEVYVLDYEKDSHTAPKKTGIIVSGATTYQVIPVETFVSGDVFEGVEEKHLLQHLLLVKVLSEGPHKLDFTHTYCFNCSEEELYRVSYVPIRDPSTIEDPVLRFQPENNFFILDSKDTMPGPMLINLKHEADDLNVDFDVDLYSGLPPPERAAKAGDGSDDDSDSETTYLNPQQPPPGEKSTSDVQSEQTKAGVKTGEGVAASEVVAELMQGDGDAKKPEKATGSGKTAMEAAVAEEESAGEETSNLTTGTEIDTDDTPDVPAVDLA